MKIINEIFDDYETYCKDKLIEEFGEYKEDNYDPVYLYQRFKCRIIETKKRKVLESKELKIPDKYLVSYSKIISDITEGVSLRKYQSRRLKNLNYDDDMLSHWGIQHLHLGEKMESDGYVLRSKELLFIYFTKEIAHIIGIFSHSSWCDKEIIEIIHANWPSEILPCKTSFKSVEISEQDHKNLRNKHVNTIVELKDGTQYFNPGLGVTANGVSVHTVTKSDNIFFMFNNAFELIKQNIKHILESMPAPHSSDKVTVGVEVCHDLESIVYVIKENNFRFILDTKT